MKFVGNKNEIYSSELPATAIYPALQLSAFQAQFHFLSNETEASMLQQVRIARIAVHRELKALFADPKNKDDKRPADINALSQNTFGDTDAGTVLYSEAVFSLAASFIVGNQLSTDTTAEAAERQEALDDKKSHCTAQYRRAVDFLTHGKSDLCFEIL